jgi:hypothetical protein
MNAGGHPTWRTYEEVSAHLLNMLARELGLVRVEGKQVLPGESGTDWEVDAKGVVEGDKAFVLVECRRTNTRQSQAKVAAFAFSIQDTGAVGGIIVTPVPLQTGAKKVAASANIQHVQIDLDSTHEEFAFKFLNRLFVGVVSRLAVTDSVDATVMRKCQECGQRFEAQGVERFCPDHLALE